MQNGDTYERITSSKRVPFLDDKCKEYTNTQLDTVDTLHLVMTEIEASIHH